MMKSGLIENNKRYMPMLAVFLVGLISGYLLFAGHQSVPASDAHSEHKEEVAQIWTCSMHPEVRQNKQGKCPKCFMDLILLDKSLDSGNPSVLKLSDAARELAEVRTAEVFSGAATRTLRLPGTAKLDETRVKHVTAWVGGRIEKLYVNYTGIPVIQGDHMAEFYSPDLIAAREELVNTAGNESLHRAVVERLLRWGISSQQIEQFKSRKVQNELVTINSPATGIVIEQTVREGMYVNQGTRLFSIADMNRLWLIASVYERDIQWLRYGQAVECEFEAFPGKIFPGVISFISPVLAADSRTVDARINLDNKNGQLKPGMFGRVTIKVSVGPGGEVINPELAGKWISPMHPEVIKDGPGACDVCGMALVPIESIGIKTSNDGNQPLIVPESAVLWSGPRSIIFREKDRDNGLYEAVEVLVGARVDSGYLIYDGLEKGDRVVVEGAFKLDSEQQIRAGTSMMSPSRDTAMPELSPLSLQEISPEMMKQLEELIKSCLEISEKLAADDLAGAAEAAGKAHEQMMALDPAAGALTNAVAPMMPLLMNIQASADIAAARENLFGLDSVLRNLLTLVKGKLSFEIHENFCPMAFDNKGAAWFQSASDLANPYFGASMLKCGSTRKVWNKENQ